MFKNKKFLFISHFDYTIWKFKIPLLRVLIEYGNIVYVACPTGIKSKDFSNIGIKHIDLNLIRNNKKIVDEISTICHIKDIIRDINPDIIHTFTIKPNIYGSIANMLQSNRKPIINSVMGMGSIYTYNDSVSKIKQSIVNFVLRIVLRYSSQVILLNSSDIEYFKKKYIVKDCQLLLIKGEGVNLNYFKPIQDKLEKDGLRKTLFGVTDNVIVLMVARLIKEKGIIEYCNSASILRKKYSNVKFIFIGDIDYGNPSHLSEEELLALKTQGDVEFIGYQDDPKPFFAASDIYCLPSYREGLPVTVMEAMASGLPIVTTNVPGCRDTVDEGINGYKVPSKNVDQLVDRLEKLIDDPVLRQHMGQSSRNKAVKEFSVERIIEQHIQLYVSILDKNRKNNKHI